MNRVDKVWIGKDGGSTSNVRLLKLNGAFTSSQATRTRIKREAARATFLSACLSIYANMNADLHAKNFYWEEVLEIVNPFLYMTV